MWNKLTVINHASLCLILKWYFQHQQGNSIMALSFKPTVRNRFRYPVVIQSEHDVWSTSDLGFLLRTCCCSLEGRKKLRRKVGRKSVEREVCRAGSLYIENKVLWNQEKLFSPFFYPLSLYHLSGIWKELGPHYGGISPQRVAQDGAFDNLVRYKELSVQFGTFQIQKHDSLNIKRVTPK